MRVGQPDTRLMFLHSLRRTALLISLMAGSPQLVAGIVEGLPIRSTDALDVQRALANLADQPDAGPLRFAVGVSTDWGVEDGQWQIEEGEAIWRLQVYSSGAANLNLALDELALPPSAQLFFSSIDGSLRHPARTARDVIAGRLWLPVVPGDTAVLEARMDLADQADFRLLVAELNHGFLDVWNHRATAKNTLGPGNSGACNVNSTCPAGDGWRDQIRSVARVTVGGQALCTGQLVNNLSTDLIYYFLTANHCRIGNEADDNPADSAVFYWNMEVCACNGPKSDTILDENTSGAQFIADGVTADYTLLRLNSAPPQSYDLYLSGFDAGSSVPSNGSSIHHPGGDNKKISLFTGQASAVDGQEITQEGRPSFFVDAWRVTWSEGTTEGGSSGGGLWSQDGELVGVLSGGEAACSGSTNNRGADFYGRLNVAWTEGESADQLRTYLDPESSGLTSSPGRNASSPRPFRQRTCAAGGGSGSSNSSGGGGSSVGGVFTACGLLAAALLRRRRLLGIVARS